MAKTCPPGVLCIENMTLLIFMLIIGLIIYVLTQHMPKSNLSTSNKSRGNDDPINNIYIQPTTTSLSPFNNPYSPPIMEPGIPINIPTQGLVNTSYQQVGILTRTNGEQTILPLFGRQLYANRDKWNYYTQSDQNNSVKLPITFKGKSGTNEYGCDSVYNGDSVFVEGYNDAFNVTVYDNSQPTYIPYL